MTIPKFHTSDRVLKKPSAGWRVSLLPCRQTVWGWRLGLGHSASFSCLRIKGWKTGDKAYQNFGLGLALADVKNSCTQKVRSRKKHYQNLPALTQHLQKYPKSPNSSVHLCVCLVLQHDPSLEDGTVISAALTAAWWQVQRTKRSRLQPGKGLVWV